MYNTKQEDPVVECRCSRAIPNRWQGCWNQSPLSSSRREQFGGIKIIISLMATISTCHQKNLKKPRKVWLSLILMLHYSYYLYLFLSDYVAGAAVLISPYFQRWKIRQPSIFIISGNKSVVFITIIREASSSIYDNCVGVGIRNGT